METTTGIYPGRYLMQAPGGQQIPVYVFENQGALWVNLPSGKSVRLESLNAEFTRIE